MSEHAKEMNEASESSHHKKKDVLSTLRGNPWIVATIILGLVLVGTFVFGAQNSSGQLSQSEVSKKVTDYLNTQVTGGQVTLDSIAKEGGLYKVMVTYQGQQVPLYVTLDGHNLVPSLIPLDGSAPAATQTQQQPTGPVNINIGNSPTIGNKDAKVTVVEFADFSCPFCAMASGDNPDLLAYAKQNFGSTWEPIVTNLMKDYVDTGKVLFVSKYSYGHSGGHPAQSVAWCLNEQNLFWKFYPLAYANQNDVEDLSKMIALAKTVGADTTKLQACLDSKKYDSQFDQEQQEGAAAGVRGTPAFFVNGKLISGAVPYSQVKAAIDAELASA